MIEGHASPNDGLSHRLTNMAGRLARARAEQIARERRADPTRWRRAALLWPLFTTET